MPDNVHPPDDPLTALRLRLLANGYEPIPVVTHDAPVKSPGKQPNLPGWRGISIDALLVRSWRTGKQGRNPGTGLRCGLLRVVDIDVLQPGVAARVDGLARQMLGPTPLRRVGRAPKQALCYRVTEPSPKAETPLYLLPDGSTAQVEVLGAGQQVVAYGIHPVTLAEYEWPDAGPDLIPLAELPLLDGVAEKCFLAAAEVLFREAGGRTEARIEAAQRTAPAAATAGQGASQGEYNSGGKAAGQKASAGSFFHQVNAAALRNIELWFKRLFPTGYWQINDTTPPGAWRVSSADLRRGLEEDISVHPTEGGQDFGTRQSKSPIDLVLEHGGPPDAIQAAHLLCEWLGVTPASLGWQEPRRARAGGSRGRGGEGAESPGRGSERGDEAWAEPIDFLADDELTGAPELRPEHVPTVIYNYAIDVAARMGVDPAAVALVTLATCASVISDDWQLQPKRHDHSWTEQPRLWVGIVGDPSILKSPVISACTKPIDRLDVEARTQHTEATKEFKIKHKAWKDAGSDPATEPRPPRLSRYMVEGTTVEALSEALRDDPDAKQYAPASKVLVRQDEMSEWLANLDRYRGGGSGNADRGAYLRLYNGGRYTYDRVGRGAFAIPNWSACFVGGIQPGPIQKVAQHAEDDGLLQRFCFCVPGQQGGGADRAPDPAAQMRYDVLIRALTTLRPMVGLGGIPARAVVLHAEAHQYREAIEALARAMAALPDTSDRLKAAYGKWRGLWARLALTFHLIEHADSQQAGGATTIIQVLSPDTARRVSAYLEEILLPHLLRADAVMFATKQTGHARWIAKFILSCGEGRIATRDIVQAYGALRAPEQRRQLLEVMEGLVTMAWLRPEERADPTRPPSAWTVNPLVLERFAHRGEAERAQRKQTREAMAAVIRSRRRRAA
jgi:hypothetical protein